MAKKKKMTRRENKKTSTLYKKFLSGCVILALGLAVYCYWDARSGDTLVISGPDYPKRTPGKASDRIQYAVYDQLAASQESKTSAVLLPPEEVPTQLPIWSGVDVPEVAQTTSSATMSDPKPSDVSKAPPVQNKIVGPSESQNIKKTENTKEPEQPDIVTKIVKNLPTVSGSKDIKKKDSVPIQKASQADKKPQDPVPASIMRMQMGSIYKAADQAHAFIQKIARRGGFPKGMRPVVQKAILQGNPVYRVVLVGHCSMKILTAYQNWLKNQKL